MLGIELDDLDMFNVPLLRTDRLRQLHPRLRTASPQLITAAGRDGILAPATTAVEATRSVMPR